MKAITLWQPFPSLIAAGEKTSETRSWAPPAGLVGERIAIHAAKRHITFADTMGWSDELVSKVCDMVDREYDGWNGNLPLGAVVATARLVSCQQVVSHGTVSSATTDFRVAIPIAITDDRRGGRDRVPIDGLGDYRVGRWVWLFDDIEPLDEPIEARGYQKLWEWEPPASFPNKWAIVDRATVQSDIDRLGGC